MQLCVVTPDPHEPGRWRAHVACASPLGTPVAERWIVDAFGYGVTMARAVGAAQAEAWGQIRRLKEPEGEMPAEGPGAKPQIEMWEGGGERPREV